MRKITFVLLLLVLLIPVSVLYAQCDIDLHAEMLTLMSAQIQADTGDTATAAATLEELSVTLSTIAGSCASTSAPLELRQQYVARDNSLTFRYPADWVMDDSDPFGYVLASSQDVLDTATASVDVPDFEAGEMTIVLFPFPLLGESFKSVAEDTSDNLLGSEFDVVVPLTPTTIGEREAFHAVFDYEGQLRVVLQLINYSNIDEPAMFGLMGIGNPADEALMQSYITAIAESIQYPPVEELRLPDSLSVSL